MSDFSAVRRIRYLQALDISNIFVYDAEHIGLTKLSVLVNNAEQAVNID